MIHFKQDWYAFNFRSAFIMECEWYILLNKNTWDNFCFLPGGRVELWEDSKTWVIREFKEETSFDLEVKDLAIVYEYFFKFKNSKYHEITHIYRTLYNSQLPKPSEKLIFTTIDEEGWKEITFFWQKISEIDDEKLNFVPEFLREILKNVKNEWIEHFTYFEPDYNN